MKKSISLLLLCFALQSLTAQDHLISVFSSSPLALNPATTGTFGNSNLRVHTGFDWISFPGLLHEYTMSLSVDKTLLKGKLGVGGMFSHEFGDDIIKSNGAMLSAAYNTAFLNDNYTFSVGMQAGLVQNSIDWDKIYFEDPLYPGSGGSILDSLGSPKENIFYSDFNLGVLVFRNTDNNRINPWIGFSVSHLFQPDNSFFSFSTPLARKLTIHAGTDISVNENITLTPLLFYTQQDNFKDLDLGVCAKYKEGSFSIAIGGISKNSPQSPFKSQQISLLAAIGYAGIELRTELLVIETNHIKQYNYSRGMLGLSWNLQKGKD